MTRAPLAVCLAAAMASSAFAEDPPAAAAPSAQSETQAAKPEPQPAAPADPVMERQRNNAAKLGGMVTFVSASCPDAKPDFTKFKQVISAMGVDIKDLEQGGPLMVRLASYVQAYQKDTPESCKRALAHFGPSGTTIPGLITPGAPDEQKP